MRLYKCHACSTGDHEHCELSHNSGQLFGGERCNCGCFGRSQEAWDEEDHPMWKYIETIIGPRLNSLTAIRKIDMMIDNLSRKVDNLTTFCYSCLHREQEEFIMSKIGSGIFSWNANERRSNRYGYIFLDKENYDHDATATLYFDKALAAKLCGKKVKMHAVVTASRQSGHIGDFFLGIFPTQPEVGEHVDLGVGILDYQPEHSDMVGLKPLDGRTELWIDPDKLYRLHDQTVDLFIEEIDCLDDEHGFHNP